MKQLGTFEETTPKQLHDAVQRLIESHENTMEELKAIRTELEASKTRPLFGRRG